MKERGMNIKDLLDRDGIKPKKQSVREFSAVCPWCGGRDRFRVWPFEENGGSFWCRVCRRGGDMVKYQMQTAGMNYFEACYELGVEPKFKLRNQQKQNQFSKHPLPSITWRNMADALVSKCEAALFDHQRREVMDYLASRGIDREVIKLVHLGWNSKSRFWDLPEWGLPDEINHDTGKPRKVWLPAGLVIPTFLPLGPNREICRIRVRRPTGDPRYVT